MYRGKRMKMQLLKTTTTTTKITTMKKMTAMPVFSIFLQALRNFLAHLECALSPNWQSHMLKRKKKSKRMMGTKRLRLMQARPLPSQVHLLDIRSMSPHLLERYLHLFFPKQILPIDPR
jgi:hypothetical protein